ncbi:MAG: DUF3416 domain-containing protein [Actinobacteria bacterium]|nr:DUF3416 domain-containing protein [Actinomycetota bacterium]
MLGRIVVTDVEPQVNCGSVPVKAISGESREVSATIFREGHEPVSATLVVRDPSDAVVARVSNKYVATRIDGYAGRASEFSGYNATTV